MDLGSKLRSIRALSDLPTLPATLGHQSLWEGVPEQPWCRLDRSGPVVFVVGRSGNLPWYGFQSRTAERDTRTLASRLCRRGRFALVLGLNGEARRLHIAVSFDRIPTLAVALDQPTPEAIAALARLGGLQSSGSVAFATRAADALASETVGRRFFRQFRATLDRMAQSLPGPMPLDARHNLALLQLTRVLFLYFIQSKGWLAGRERFLPEEVERCLSRRRRIHRDLLRPLFFGTLNRPAALRSRTAIEFGTIPFLNGGLFEPHPLERQFRADLGNELWRDAFDLLFERFHFTVTEQGSHGAVAPDMLGRVFEGVMAPENRRASGTFYTPASLVKLVLNAALVALISGRFGCGESQAERRLVDGDPEVAQLLRRMTLLDPAVGSGAFLLGALESLTARASSPRDTAHQKRLVLQYNLFGVDQSAAAVRLTELRLWLAVIADEPAERPTEITPLPNLDCLIRQGDSLFDPVGPQLHGYGHSRELLAELSSLRREVVTATGVEKRCLIRRLRLAEARAVSASIDEAEHRQHAAIEECIEQARSRDLFGQRRGMDLELRRRIEQLRTGLRGLRDARRRLTRDGEVPWFHYQSHFADVFSHGGFDLVVGNPPWLRSEAIAPELRARLSGRYHWWRCRGPGYRNGPDLAVAFLERGLELTRQGGMLAMLIPAKLLTAGYAARVRHDLATTTTLHAVADLTASSAAEFEATVYPLALVVRRAKPASAHRVRSVLTPDQGNRIRQSELAGGGPWILNRTSVRGVLAALEREYPRVGDRVTCHLGLKTGLNQVFLNPPSELEPEVLRWALRGRDLKPFRASRKIRLLWTHDHRGRPRRELPARAAAYLSRHETELRARADFQTGPPWTVFRAVAARAKYRVIWADLARRLTAAPLYMPGDRSLIPLNTCYVAPTSNAFQAQLLAAWLNSTWLRALARLNATPASSGFARFNARVVSHLPLPESAWSDRRLAWLARLGRGGAGVQKALDNVVAKHLELSRSAQRALRATLDCRANHRR